MTFTTIAVVCLIKGTLVAVLMKLGKWKTHEQRREERLVLLAYREWRKGAGARHTTKASISAERLSEFDR